MKENPPEAALNPTFPLTPRSYLMGFERVAKLVGLFGKNIQRSNSPALHEQEARALGFPLCYPALSHAARMNLLFD